MATVVQSKREEVANSISHGIGFAASLAAIPILVVSAARNGDAGTIVGGAIFGSAMAVLYLASTLYHAVRPGRAKQLLRRFDHAAIFLLIAGTYTPFTLGVLGGAWGWSLFGIIWALAALGIALDSLPQKKPRILPVVIYLVMGWLCLIALKPLFEALPTNGFAWLLAGGIFYTVGVVFYALDDRVRYFHGVWHLFVLAGSLSHYVTIFFYVLAQ